MSISLKEIIKDVNFSSLPKPTQDNLMTLLERVNKVRDAYGKAMVVSSGLRTMEQHLAIYKAKGITDQSKIPMKSRHLIGAACDFSDSKKELQEWCKKNESLLKTIGLWMENFDYTSKPNAWVHFQCLPYGSYVDGKSLWFVP